MFAWINGNYILEEDATVSVFDRGFLYGDGLFETMPVRKGNPIQWLEHWARLERSAAALNIHLPFNEIQLRSAAAGLIHRNCLEQCVLRMTLTRGRGVRGYSPKGAGASTLVLTLHPMPSNEQACNNGMTLVVSSYRVLAGDPLLQIKSGSQLIRVMARAEAEERQVDDALLLNHLGRAAETASANLFWLRDSVLHTPPLWDGALPGITRAALMALCPKLGLRCAETETGIEDLRCADGVFLANSVMGIVEVAALDGCPLTRSNQPRRLLQAYRQALAEDGLS